MDFDQLLQNCESEIERHLLNALYPALGPNAQREIEAQHIIDYYDLPATLPDFAFPNARIAIYCDGYEYHSDRDSFLKDRQQLRGLQLQGWCVLRFSGSEILNDTDAVVFTIQTAIRRKVREQANHAERLRLRTRNAWLWSAAWGFFAGGMVATVVLMILLEYFAPTLFFHLTGGL